jgi:hypothetical protein
VVRPHPGLRWHPYSLDEPCRDQLFSVGTSRAVAQRLLALDIYYEAIATPHRCSATRSETIAIMGCRTCGDEDAPTEAGIR